MFWNKSRTNMIGEILSGVGKSITLLFEEVEKRDEGKQHLIIELVRKTHSFDELNLLISKYGGDDSIALTLALIVQAVELRFSELEKQINLRSRYTELAMKEIESHISALSALVTTSQTPARTASSIRWTAKRKKIRSMFEKGMSFMQIVGSGYSKSTVSRVKAALQDVYRL
jgi:hypothetical protein